MKKQSAISSNNSISPRAKVRLTKLRDVKQLLLIKTFAGYSRTKLKKVFTCLMIILQNFSDTSQRKLREKICELLFHQSLLTLMRTYMSQQSFNGTSAMYWLMTV